jgi:hypothetical protein
MKKLILKQKYSGYVFGEGRKDKKFLMALIDLKKFRYHIPNWRFNYGNASGCAAEEVLKRCRKETSGVAYNLILCFVDLDDLKNDYPGKWEEKKKKLEDIYSDFVVIWQVDNIEDEFKKVLGDIKRGKHGLNREAQKNVDKFINSDFWKKILKPIKEKEKVFPKKNLGHCPK